MHGETVKILLGHSVNAHIMGSHIVYKITHPITCAFIECTSTMFVLGLMMAQWAETCREIFNIEYQNVLCLLTEKITIL